MTYEAGMAIYLRLWGNASIDLVSIYALSKPLLYILLMTPSLTTPEGIPTPNATMENYHKREPPYSSKWLNREISGKTPLVA